MLQEILWLLWCAAGISIAMYFNGWVIPIVVALAWPEFAGEQIPMSHSGAAVIAWCCCAAGIVFSRGLIAIIVGAILGKMYADKVRGN